MSATTAASPTMAVRFSAAGGGCGSPDPAPAVVRVGQDHQKGTIVSSATITNCDPPPTPALRIAILLNSYRSPFISEIRDSYVRAIGAVSPASTLVFFYPAEGHDEADGVGFPDPDAYDLIVVGGGNADPRKRHAWILRVHAFVRDVAARRPRKKLCGICWGHQTIAMLFGGEVVDMATPELGVTEAKLTPAGKRFFPQLAGNNGNGNGIIRLQQHHRRAVGVRPEGFYELLAGHQAFLSHSNTILTFQGHPEKDARTAKLRVRDAGRWFGTDLADRQAVGDVLGRMDMQHDGAEVWCRVLQWAADGV